MKMESSYSSSLEKDIADIPSSTLLVTPSLSYSHSDSSATTTNDYDDDDDHNSTDKLCHDHDYASSDIDGKVFQLSTSRSALSSVYPTSIEASSNILSSSLASIASNVSLSSSTSYIRSRRRAPATTLATSPVTKAIVIPSTTDAATYAAATMESLPKSASPLYSYDEDTHYSSLDTLNYDEFRFIITEFGVISHIRDRPTVEQRRFPLSSYTPSPTTPGGGLATLTRICASALGLGGDNTDDTTANTEAHSLLSASSVSSRVSAITLCSSKAIGQPIFRYVHNDDLPVLCRTLSRACARVSRCAIRWSSEIDQDHMTRRQSTLSKDTPINSADHKSGNHLATTSVNWRWVWITICQFDDFMVCTLRRPLDDEEDEEGHGGSLERRRHTFSGISGFLINLLLPNSDEDEEDDDDDDDDDDKEVYETCMITDDKNQQLFSNNEDEDDIFNNTDFLQSTINTTMTTITSKTDDTTIPSTMDDQTRLTIIPTVKHLVSSFSLNAVISNTPPDQGTTTTANSPVVTTTHAHAVGKVVESPKWRVNTSQYTYYHNNANDNSNGQKINDHQDKDRLSQDGNDKHNTDQRQTATSSPAYLMSMFTNWTGTTNLQNTVVDTVTRYTYGLFGQQRHHSSHSS